MIEADDRMLAVPVLVAVPPLVGLVTVTVGADPVFKMELGVELAVLDPVGMFVAVLDAVGDPVNDDEVTVAPLVLPVRLTTIEVGTEPVLEEVKWVVDSVVKIEFVVALAVLLSVGLLVATLIVADDPVDNNAAVAVAPVTIDVGTELVLDWVEWMVDSVFKIAFVVAPAVPLMVGAAVDSDDDVAPPVRLVTIDVGTGPALEDVD